MKLLLILLLSGMILISGCDKLSLDAKSKDIINKTSAKLKTNKECFVEIAEEFCRENYRGDVYKIYGIWYYPSNTFNCLTDDRSRSDYFYFTEQEIEECKSK